MTPIEQLLNEVEFTPLGSKPNDSGLPYATHTGIMKIGEVEIEVSVLNDGRRIISTDAMDKVFGEGWQEVYKSALK